MFLVMFCLEAVVLMLVLSFAVWSLCLLNIFFETKCLALTYQASVVRKESEDLEGQVTL